MSLFYTIVGIIDLCIFVAQGRPLYLVLGLILIVLNLGDVIDRYNGK